MEKKNCEMTFSCVYNYYGSLYYLGILLKKDGFKRDYNEYTWQYEDDDSDVYYMNKNILITEVGNFAQVFVEITASGSSLYGNDFGETIASIENLIDSAENTTVWRSANGEFPLMSNDEMWELFETQEIDEI